MLALKVVQLEPDDAADENEGDGREDDRDDERGRGQREVLERDVEEVVDVVDGVSVGIVFN